MDRASLLALLAAAACGGTEPVDSAAPVEQCANGVDDDGDARVDCADADCAEACGYTTTTGSGTPTGTATGGFTGTTGVTNPSSPLSLVVDPTIQQWQHQVGLTQCPQPLGRILIDNGTADQAQIVVWADRYQDEDVFLFNLENQTPIEAWVDWPVPAGAQGVVWVYYACNAPGSFSHLIQVEFSTATEHNGALILSSGTIL